MNISSMLSSDNGDSQGHLNPGPGDAGPVPAEAATGPGAKLQNGDFQSGNGTAGPSGSSANAGPGGYIVSAIGNGPSSGSGTGSGTGSSTSLTAGPTAGAAQIDNQYLAQMEARLALLVNIDDSFVNYDTVTALNKDLTLRSHQLNDPTTTEYTDLNLLMNFIENKDVIMDELRAGTSSAYTRNKILKKGLGKGKKKLGKPGPKKALGSVEPSRKRRRSITSTIKPEKKPTKDSKATTKKTGAKTDAKTDKKGAGSKEEKLVSKQYDNTFISIWKDLARKEGPKISRLMQQSTQARSINFRKTSILAAREAKRWQLKNNKNQKDLSSKARRAMREMFNFWKRNERVERELRRKHEKELLDKAKREEEERESKRQSRKLNFLITQTELYSHFIGKKIKTDEIEGADTDPNLPPAKDASKHHYDQYTGVTGKSTDFNSIDFDNEDEENLQRAAAMNAQLALDNARSKAESFNGPNQAQAQAKPVAQAQGEGDDPFKNPDTNGEEMNFQNPTLMGDLNVTQPDMLKCTLKEYQVKGLNWLANLYEQGINGILADEMGLGKTVQSISVLAYLAETHNIWGPYLVVTPASTLHNWQQEITKFVPEFKVLPYWGNAKDRKVLRKFWDRKNYRYQKDAPFHVLVTSYQLVVADAPYFQKMKWQYMILDEAQAIKSSQSSRWKSLLSFNCRNRLLLTGTPIQNSMQELWALLHFIMPSLFDSHDEFSDWFSKDIESHAQSNTQLNEEQLKRLHVILKPFMLRRIKKNVQSELGDKLEIDIFCDLTNRQKKYYQMLRSQISIMDLLEPNNANKNDDEAQSLINLVMQFRKVCNHPDLFERADVESSFAFSKFADTVSFLRESNDLLLNYSTTNQIDFSLPRLIYEDLMTPSYDNNVGSVNKINQMFNIYDPANQKYINEVDGANGWLRFVDSTSQELNKLSRQDILTRAIDHKEYTDINYSGINRYKYLYEDTETKGYIPQDKKLLISEYNNDYSLMANSTHLKALYSIPTKVYEDMNINSLQPAAEPIACAPPINVVCNNNQFNYDLNNTLYNPQVRTSLSPLSLNHEYELMKAKVPVPNYPKSDMLPNSLNKLIDYSNIRMPSMNRFITESGKLAKLDLLLQELKANDHRVLIYFQMTKMMDLMEEYLTYKQHSYIRLDGSSKLDDRRDLVHDWQNKPELFIFLLSTRAGGLGINLTAADTVIFYDSDWNPTIDSQAMDRAHRLGQTKQVTVYRLLMKNTIEERMRDRAKQKEQVQQVVMEGKSSGVKEESAKDKKKDVAYLLLGGEPEPEDEALVLATPAPTDSTPAPGVTATADTPADSEATAPGAGAPGAGLEDMYHEDEGNFTSS